MISMTKGFSTHKNSAPNVRFAFNTRRPRYVRKKKNINTVSFFKNNAYL